MEPSLHLSLRERRHVQVVLSCVIDYFSSYPYQYAKFFSTHPCSRIVWPVLGSVLSFDVVLINHFRISSYTKIKMANGIAGSQWTTLYTRRKVVLEACKRKQRKAPSLYLLTFDIPRSQGHVDWLDIGKETSQANLGSNTKYHEAIVHESKGKLLGVGTD